MTKEYEDHQTKTPISQSELNDGLCAACGHALKHHTPYGCEGAFPNGTEGVSPDEIFYGECHCTVRPKKEAGA